MEARQLMMVLFCWLGWLQTGQCQQQNHALVIGLDHYQLEDVWESRPELRENIDSVLLFFRTDRIRKFQVDSLRNENATLDKIVAKFQNLKVKQGDRVMIYLTGHGSQVPDLDDDEKDGTDEVFVCYDSPSPDDVAGLRKKSLVDDKLHELLVNLRTKLGSQGQVFLLVESCHSGSIEKNGVKKSFNAYSRDWQTAFMSEHSENGGTEKLAPLITFSSSRAYNPTGVVYRYTLCFLAEFQNFITGSYYDLFRSFYLAQRQKQFNKADIQLTVNMSADDPYYLRLGVLEDTVYEEKKMARIINTDYTNPARPQYEIDLGLYQGLTTGSAVKLTATNGHVYPAQVSFVKSGSSMISLTDGTKAPSIEEAWGLSVEVTQYNFEDTLHLAIDASVPADKRKDIVTGLQDLEFVLLAQDSIKGYSLAYIDKRGYFIKRNKDNKALFVVKDRDVSSIRATVLKLQINRFIIQLNTTQDTTVTLVLQQNGQPLKLAQLSRLSPGQKLQLYVQPGKLAKSQFYCILQLEDEIIRQLVPVNVRINESDCKLAKGQSQPVFIGDIIVGKRNGSFLLITSESPIDLREVMLEPLSVKTKGIGEFNALEKLVNQLFLNKGNHPPLYNSNNIFTQQLSYRIQSLSLN
ncbi:caspase family protein [Filimonas lacunae]|nr:caspase family protein [Filimonas lacunae]